MDPLVRRDFLATLLSAEHIEGTTVFISSHLLNEVERVAEYVGLLHQGKLVLSSRLDHLKESEFEVEVVFNNPPSLEEIQKYPGVISVEKKGAQWIIEYRGEREKLQAALASFQPSYINFNPLNLEEIFFRYVEKERGA
jgi:ABC-2 type transport system ATP-binding protein